MPFDAVAAEIGTKLGKGSSFFLLVIYETPPRIKCKCGVKRQGQEEGTRRGNGEIEKIFFSWHTFKRFLSFLFLAAHRQ